MSMNEIASIETFLPLMHDVGRCDRSLRELNLTWRMIESSTKMNCPEEARRILPTMATTREHFNRLEQELVASLVREKVATVMREISTKAHYVIDIVVRNLYERTADIGFLATDGELCSFVAGLHDDRDAIVERLRAYRSKYTVYDEIFLLDPQGRVLAQIDDAAPLEWTADALVRAASASDGSVEIFRASDLRPSKRRALVYARRMLHPQTGAVVGVLCLCFNFEQEMAGIFASHRDPAARYDLLLLDGDNRCIESADHAWIAPGAQLPVNRTSAPEVFMYAGRQYLVSTFAAQGYQGYAGPPGWQGQVMIPLDVAFGSDSQGRQEAVDPALRRGLLTHARAFCPPLHQIVVAADTIRRVVWNGQVMTAGRQEGMARLKTVLEQLSETGSRSNELFAQSIRDLYDTVLSSGMRNAEFVSHLLVDLLDRNLYERADDCRWWALTPLFRHTLAGNRRDAGDLRRIAGMLDYINRLYTVYTRLFVYDSDGVIVAHSDRDHAAQGVTGSRVGAATLDRVKALRTEQGYVVTPFEANPLYDGAATYVYHAAIRSPDDASRVVGGIGIVFDSTAEFPAMLAGGLAGRTGTDAFFIDRQGLVISSTDPARPVGSVLEIEPSLLALASGASAASLVVHDGQYAIMGCTVSSGYREFKVSDGYREDVIAVVYERFGAVRKNIGTEVVDLVLDGAGADHSGQEYATFFSGATVFALDVEHVREARPGSEVTRVTIGCPARSAGVLRLNPARADEKMIWVFDLALLLGSRPSALEDSSQVVVVEHQGRTIGLLVGELHAVSAFDAAHMSNAPLAGASQLVKGIIKANGGASLIQLLDVDCLFDLFQPPKEIPAANDAVAVTQELATA